jgi:hypothetical protein
MSLLRITVGGASVPPNHPKFSDFLTIYIAQIIQIIKFAFHAINRMKALPFAGFAQEWKR